MSRSLATKAGDGASLFEKNLAEWPRNNAIPAHLNTPWLQYNAIAPLTLWRWGHNKLRRNYGWIERKNGADHRQTRTWTVHSVSADESLMKRSPLIFSLLSFFPFRPKHGSLSFPSTPIGINTWIKQRTLIIDGPLRARKRDCLLRMRIRSEDMEELYSTRDFPHPSLSIAVNRWWSLHVNFPIPFRDSSKQYEEENGSNGA